MNHKFNKAVALIATAAIAATTVASLAACTTNEPEKLAKDEFKVGYYELVLLEDEGNDGFWHFYENNTFYYSYAFGSTNGAGTYEIVEETHDYYADYVHTDDAKPPVESSKSSADYWVIATTYGGEEYKFTYKDGMLYDYTIPRMRHRNAKYVAEAPSIAEREDTFSITVELLYANNSESDTLMLKHDKSFVDYTGATGCEGTWAKTSTGYTLTTEDNATYTLTKENDGSYSYKKGEDTITLKNEIVVEKPATVDLFAGNGVAATDDQKADTSYVHHYVLAGNPAFAAAQNYAATYKMECNESAKTFEIKMSISTLGINNLVIASGTYTAEPDSAIGGFGPKYVFTFEGNDTPVTVQGAPNMNVHPFEVDYTLNLALTDVPVTINIGAEFTGTISVNVALKYSYVTSVGAPAKTVELFKADGAKKPDDAADDYTHHYVLAGNPAFAAAQNYAATYKMECNESAKTFEIKMSISTLGINNLVIASGTYTDDGDTGLGGMAPKYVFTFEGNDTPVTVSGTPNMNVHPFEVDYTLNLALTDVPVTINIGAEFTGTISVNVALTYSYVTSMGA